MKTYTTVQGDMFDSVSKKMLGSEAYTDRLIRANLKYRDIHVFSAGIELDIPDINKTKQSDNLPPWKKVSG